LKKHLKSKIENKSDHMKTHTRSPVYALPISTTDGEFLARYSKNGLCSLDFPAGSKRATNGASDEPPVQIRRWHALTSKALANALAGKTPGPLPPLDLSAGTDFQKQVWQSLRAISCGRTSSYGHIARTIGRPKAVRAVGGACGANPIPVLVPCHRVLAANRRLGGFSGGLDWKRTLLAREGVVVEP
jgi:O-6-methylguanine DNA methyltransferase